MFYLIVKLVVSLVMGNWVYSEASLLVPGFEKYAREFCRTVRIPTHNEWPAAVSPGAARRLERQVESAQKQVLPAGWGSWNVFDERVRKLWQTGRLSSLWNGWGASKNPEFLSGEEIFLPREESEKLFYIARRGAQRKERSVLKAASIPPTKSAP